MSDMQRLIDLGGQWLLPFDDEDLKFDIPFLLQTANRLYGFALEELEQRPELDEDPYDILERVINGERHSE